MKRLFIGAMLLPIWICSCTFQQADKKEKPVILATTGMLGDIARNLCGEFAEIHVLMGPGVDPHLYKASQGDMNLISNADIILYNGLHLEGKMVEILEKTSRTKPVIPAGMYASAGKLLHSENSGSAVDPHIWMDVRLWAEVAAGIADTLDSLFPEHSESIQTSTIAYLGSLDKLQVQVDSLIQQIPENGRVLITSHDAFRYFGKAYGMEVRGLQGISTVSEYGLRDISEMSSFIVERKIKAVFVETSVSSKSLESVISSCRKQGHDLQLGGELFSDAMGDDGSEEGTYEGMILHNARTISNALK